MSESLTAYGKLCRKYRIDKGWTMDDAARNLGCRQSYLSQIETAKTKQRKTRTGETRTAKVRPTLGFIMKSMDVYQLNSAEKLDFLFKVLMDTERIEIPLKNSFQARTEFIGLRAVFLLNNDGQYPQENKEVWEKVKKVKNFLMPYTVL